MKKIFTLASAILIATSAMAYDTATEGEAYYGSSCCAYGLADGTVAITTYYLDTENPTTEITLPATIQVWNEDGTEMTAEYEVSQVGYSTWNNLWVSDGSETNVLSTMTSITFTEGIKTINTSAFGWMSNPALTTIVLPSTMTLIKAGAFASCDNLTSITCNAATAPTLDSSEGWNDQFKGATSWDYIANNCKVYVPSEEAQASYNQETWSYWNAFYEAGNVVVAQGNGITAPTVATLDTPAYNIAGQRIADGTKGLIIKNGKKVIVR